MRVSGRHWAFALAVAVLIHAGVAAAVLWCAPTPGARGSGIGGIQISLGSVGGAPQPETASDVVSAASAATAKPVEQEPILPEPAISEPVPPEPVPPEPVPPEPEPIAPEPEPVIPEPPKPEPAVTEPVAPKPVPPEPEPIAPEPEPPVAEPAIETVPSELVKETEVIPPPPESEPKPESEVPKKQVAARVVTPPPAPRTKPTPPPRTVPPSPAAAAPPAPAAPAAPDQTASAVSSPSGVAGDGGDPDAAGAVTRTGGGMKGDYVDYLTRLQAWLERHKEYPRRARRQGREGTILLYFVMDREGRVLDYRISESSGDELLDRAATEMIERAQPLPELPETMRQARLEIVVPVEFTLR